MGDHILSNVLPRLLLPSHWLVAMVTTVTMTTHLVTPPHPGRNIDSLSVLLTEVGSNTTFSVWSVTGVNATVGLWDKALVHIGQRSLFRVWFWSILLIFGHHVCFLGGLL